MRKVLALGLGAVLLIVGTGAVLAQTATPATAPANPAASAAASAAPGVGPKATVERVDLLDKVLKALVADGTIDQAQADKITARLKTERDALKADLQAKREAAKALRQQIRGFLADGVIDANELAQLPADNPLRNLDKFLDDGKLTLDELRQLGVGKGRGFGLGRDKLKVHADDGDADEAAPSASAATGS